MTRDGQMRNLSPGYRHDSFWDGVTPWAGGRQGGARAADFINLDLRFGWRARPSEGDTLDIYLDVINVFNRANFNPALVCCRHPAHGQ